MQMNYKLNKAGVSLIAVLLFMLIATIAATATWKWITSEGFSSTSRMLKREAYQSSMAGIENARAWMTYHANDLGAVIKQYLDGVNGVKQPINLDDRLRSLQRAGQNYHVWLTGVNVEGSVYKVKIYSAGEARNNARHNEVAIFNVEGLYRVNVPEEHIHRVSDFDYNYFGGTTINHGDIFARSMLVNGDLLDGNPASIDSNLVVTGNFKVSGNSIAVHGTACVGGNLDADNGMVGNNFYVDGDLKNLKIRPLTAKKGTETVNLGNSIYGNLYVNGNITAANGNQVIDGNLTLNGKWTTNMSGYEAGVGGNLCVGESGQIYFPNLNREFKAKGMVWMESDLPLWVDPGMSWFGAPSEVDNYSKYKRISLGTKDKDVYVKTGHPSSEYKTLRNNTYKFNEIEGKPFACSGEKNGTPDCNMADRKWTNKRDVKVFIDRAEKPDLYYLYNWNSATPVVSYAEDNFVDSYWTNHPATLTLYKVNGERFWDTYNASSLNTLNYSGSRPTGTPYCYQGTGVGPEQYRAKARPTCGVTPWFRVEGNFKSPFPGSKPSDLTCAESVKAHCDSLWEPSDGCGSAKYLVPDPLRTGISYFESYANNNTCVKNYVENMTKGKTEFNFANFHDCYTTAKDDEQLYNGYLVVKINNAANDIFVSSKGALDGKYIFIFEGDFRENIKLPATASGSYAFLYFKDGWGGEILPMDDAGDQEFNYFIYTKNDINNILFNQTVLKGSVYAAVKDEETGTKTCAKVNNLTFNKGMEFNQELVSDLTDAGVICKNDGSSCGGVGGSPTTSTSSEEVTEDSEGGKDRYYISMAPQINVSVESMYEAEERQPAGNANQPVNSSYIILPRIIYLPGDPYGELKDYYNVVPLNGSSLTKSDVVNSVSCSGAGSLPVTGKLFDGHRLTQGIYKCAAEPAGQSRIPFWVVVGNSLRGDGVVSFELPAQTMGTSSVKEVNLMVSPHSTELDVAVNCPEVPNSSWRYTINDAIPNTKTGNTCVFTIPVNTQDGLYKLFTVETANATSGKLTFTLQPGTGYTLSSPYYTDLMVASTASIIRTDVTSTEMSQYCEDHPGVCPSDRSRWPDCSYSGLWVEPQGGTSAIVTNDLNDMWSVSLGGEGSFSFVDRSGGGKCVVIIPETDNEILKSSMEADHSYSLRATAKALTRTLRIAFAGDVGNGNSPEISYSTNSGNGVCRYSNAGLGLTNACTVSVFDGEEVSLGINLNDNNNEAFSYWKCSGGSCPETSGAQLNGAATFDSFVLNDNETVVYAHFGETDKHCFIEEFKDNDVSCHADKTEYCIDKCDDSDNSLCVGAVDANGKFTNAKWHLLSGSLDNIEAYAGHVSIVNKRKVTRGVNNKNSAIKVISTVNAGYTGTLKALFRMPQETSSYDRFADNISRSGFMLRSDMTGMEYLMLNVYVNKNGYLETQICTESAKCLNAEPKLNGLSISASTASMVMMSATLSAENKLIISVFSGTNYYGSPSEYTHTFTLTDLPSTYADRAHEYVGFSLADPNFKLYGIGWESFDYQSQCWDTPPSIKCSFAAKAQNGIIELGKNVVPWVGHSGWFNSLSCTPQYFYYNGDDAGCGNALAAGVQCTNGYTFEAKGKGQHGYGADKKTAKVELECSVPDAEQTMWLQSTQTEHGKAHCGLFWTGAFSPCTEHYMNLVVDKILQPASENLTEELIVEQTSRARRNMRDATLNVVLDNPDSNEVEIALVSKHDFDNATVDTSWGDKGASNDIYISQSVKMRGNSAIFDVSDMANGAEGFDPEKVRSIILRNHGETPVTVKSISTNCKSVVAVTSCKAEYKDSDGAWVVTANVSNYDKVSQIKTTMAVEGVIGSSSVSVCGAEGVNCVKDAGSGIVTFTIPDNPYAYRGRSYQFSVTALNGTIGGTTNCSVSPDPIGEVSRECRVNPTSIQQEAGMPQFQFTLYGCPKTGCPYKIYLDESNTEISSGTAASNVAVKYTAAGNGTGSAIEKGNHKYRVVSDDTNSPFDACEATFIVTEKKSEDEAVKTNCWFEGPTPPFRPGMNIAMKFTVNNNNDINITGRNYRLTLPDNNVINGSTGTGSEQNVQFAVPNNGGSTVLEVWDKNTYKTACNIDMEVLSVAPKDCELVNNNAQLRANFDYTCDNGACPWELKKSYKNSVSSVATGNVSGTQIYANTNGPGVYTMWVNGTEYEDCSVIVGPKVTCPTVATVMEANKENSLFMTRVTMCDNDDGCNYTFKPEVGLEESVTDGSYKGASTAIPVTPTTVKNGIGYVFTVSSAADANLVSSCEGTINVVDQITCSQITKTIDQYNSSFSINSGSLQNGCVEVYLDGGVCTGQVQIELQPCNNQTGTWNGTSFTLNSNNNGYYEFSTNPTPYATKYKLDMPACPTANINKIYVTGCTVLNAASDKPSLTCPEDHSRYPSSTINIPVSNCNVAGGCTYTVTKNSSAGSEMTTYANNISIAGESSGTYTYELAVTNSKGTVSDCSFDVTYSDNVYEPVSIGTRYNGQIKISLTTTNTTCELSASSNAWENWIESGASVKASYGTSGHITVSDEVKMLVPSNEWVNISNCW